MTPAELFVFVPYGVGFAGGLLIYLLGVVASRSTSSQRVAA